MGFVDLHFALLSEEPNNLDAARVVSADEALKNLKAGNAGFAGGKSRPTHDTPIPDLRKSLKGGSIRIVGAVHDMHTGKVALK